MFIFSFINLVFLQLKITFNYCYWVNQFMDLIKTLQPMRPSSSKSTSTRCMITFTLGVSIPSLWISWGSTSHKLTCLTSPCFGSPVPALWIHLLSCAAVHTCLTSPGCDSPVPALWIRLLSCAGVWFFIHVFFSHVRVCYRRKSWNHVANLRVSGLTKMSFKWATPYY